MSRRKKSRRPRWTVTTFGKIEEVRKSLRWPKLAMADLLGVTNSTYHNWASGKAVPVESRQRQIAKALERAGQSRASGDSQAIPEAVQATAEVVRAYLATGESLEPEGLVSLTRGVLAALGGAE